MSWGERNGRGIYRSLLVVHAYDTENITFVSNRDPHLQRYRVFCRENKTDVYHCKKSLMKERSDFEYVGKEE